MAGATAQNPFSLLVAARSQPHGDGMRKPRALKSDSGKIGTPDLRTTYQEIAMQELTDDQILTVARRKFRDGHTADPAKLHAYCETVRTVIACYNLEPVTQAVRDVLAERRRQIEVEGFTPKRGDGYGAAELAEAAGSYALHAYSPRCAFTPAWWPWARAWWKPGTPRQMLVKAGALILAAIEQIDRRAAK